MNDQEMKIDKSTRGCAMDICNCCMNLHSFPFLCEVELVGLCAFTKQKLNIARVKIILDASMVMIGPKKGIVSSHTVNDSCKWYHCLIVLRTK